MTRGRSMLRQYAPRTPTPPARLAAPAASPPSPRPAPLGAAIRNPAATLSAPLRSDLVRAALATPPPTPVPSREPVPSPEPAPAPLRAGAVDPTWDDRPVSRTLVASAFDAGSSLDLPPEPEPWFDEAVAPIDDPDALDELEAEAARVVSPGLQAGVFLTGLAAGLVIHGALAWLALAALGV